MTSECVSFDTNLARVDAKDRNAGLRTRWRELDLPVNASWPEKSRVENIYGYDVR